MGCTITTVLSSCAWGWGSGVQEAAIRSAVYNLTGARMDTSKDDIHSDADDSLEMTVLSISDIKSTGEDTSEEETEAETP